MDGTKKVANRLVITINNNTPAPLYEAYFGGFFYGYFIFRA